jgi:hypothetical protein
MSERNPFQQNPGQQSQKGALQCEEWEALLADALDGTLAAEDTAVFTAHGNDCPMCAEMLAQARQGQEWMKFLQEEPPAPADLVAKILGRTSGAALPQLAVAGAAQPIVPHVAHFTMRNTFRDSRILMTVAMAFFSIMLTLNMAGIHLNSLRMADLKPSALQTNFARQFYGAKKQMVSYYESLRLVYEVESKMRELRRDAESEQQNPQPRKDDKQQGTPQGTPQGNARKNGGRLQAPRNLEPVMCGQPVLASLERSQGPGHPKTGAVQTPDELKKFEEKVLLSVREETDQAERSLA